MLMNFQACTQIFRLKLWKKKLPLFIRAWAKSFKNAFSVGGIKKKFIAFNWIKNNKKFNLPYSRTRCTAYYTRNITTWFYDYYAGT